MAMIGVIALRNMGVRGLGGYRPFPLMKTVAGGSDSIRGSLSRIVPDPQLSAYLAQAGGDDLGIPVLIGI